MWFNSTEELPSLKELKRSKVVVIEMFQRLQCITGFCFEDFVLLKTIARIQTSDFLGMKQEVSEKLPLVWILLRPVPSSIQVIGLIFIDSIINSPYEFSEYKK